MAKKPIATMKTMDEAEKKILSDRLTAWKLAKDKAAKWTSAEMELRKELFAEYFPDATEGTNNFVLEFGKVLKANKVISRGVDKAQLTAVLEEEAAKRKADKNYQSNILPLIEEVVTYDPKVSVSAYKALSEESQKLLADIITIKDGAPSLSIETPKT